MTDTHRSSPVTAAAMEQPPYYAKDGKVWKHPIQRREKDQTVITLGFPVAIMHEAVGKEAAETIAVLMNRGDIHNDLVTALEAALHTLDCLDPRGGKLVHPLITEKIDETVGHINAALAKSRATGTEP